MSGILNDAAFPLVLKGGILQIRDHLGDPDAKHLFVLGALKKNPRIEDLTFMFIYVKMQ